MIPPSPARPPLWRTAAAVLCAGLAALAPARAQEEPPARPEAGATSSRPVQPAAEPTAPPTLAEVTTILEELPEPDLEGLDAEIAQQLRDARAALDAATAAADPTRIAREAGELAQLYHAYAILELAEPLYGIAALDGGEARWPYLFGHLLMDQGRYEEAVSAFSVSLKRELQYAPSHFHLGVALLEQGALESARATLEATLGHPWTEPAAAAALGRMAAEQGEHRAAVEMLERALALAPSANRLHYALATSYRELGEEEKSREHLEQYGQVGVKPTDPWLEELEELRVGQTPFLLRGRRAFQAGRYREAAAEFAKAVASRPDDAGARIDHAAALDQLGKVDEALAELGAALDREPQNATAHFNLGLILKREGAMDRALGHFALAARENPADLEARLELARSLRAVGRTVDAAIVARRVRGDDPAVEEAYVLEAVCQAELGLYASALDILLQGAERLPESGAIASRLARLYAASPLLELRDGAAAADLALRVYEARPTLEHAELVALALAESGRCADAAAWQQRALEAAVGGGSSPEEIQRIRRELWRLRRDAEDCRPPASEPADR